MYGFSRTNDIGLSAMEICIECGDASLQRHLPIASDTLTRLTSGRHTPMRVKGARALAFYRLSLIALRYLSTSIDAYIG